MTKQELSDYLVSGHPIDVHVEEIPAPTGFVKKIQILPTSIHSDYTVVVEYELTRLYVSRDYEGAHIKYQRQYQELDAAIADLECYLDKPIQEWTNYTRAPLEPTSFDEVDEEFANAYFENLAQAGDLLLPNGVIFYQVKVYEYDPADDPDVEALEEYLRENPT